MLRAFSVSLFLVVAATTSSAQRSRSEYVVAERVVGDRPITRTATYDCDLVNLWTAQRHPNSFPARTGHWSPPVAVSHGRAYGMFEPGVRASDGVEQVAEVRERRTSRQYATVLLELYHETVIVRQLLTTIRLFPSFHHHLDWTCGYHF